MTTADRPAPSGHVTTALACRAVRKAYATTPVLRGVDLDVHPGEVCFLLGVNGAGKSTLLGCLAGTVAWDEGAVQLQGRSIDLRTLTDGALAPLALVPQRPPLAGLLTPDEHLAAMCALRGLDDAARRAFDEAAEALGIAAMRGQPCRTLSGGTQQKVGLALGLASQVPVLLLDEPWTGLDILSARALRRLLAAAREQGRALLVASHLPETAVQLADRCVVLAGGRVAATLERTEMAAFGGSAPAFEEAIVSAMQARP